jgi:tricorn protease
VGRLTRGVVIGSDSRWRMIDGGRIAVPNYGMLTERDGWIIEGVGVPPDVGVPPELGAANDPHVSRPEGTCISRRGSN